MRWSPNTTGGSRFFVTKAEYRVSALDGRDGYGSDAEYLPRRPRSHIQISATGRSRHSRYPACPVRFKSGHSSSRRPGGEYIQGVPAGDAAALKMRPTTAPSASTLGIVLWRRKLWGSGTLSSAGCP